MAEINFFEGACWYGMFLFSTTLHEASHAFAAHKLGDDTAYRAGQVSLDPTPHIKREPLGMVVVPIVFYLLSQYIVGWASAPYDPDWERRYPRRAGIMAMAGPAANLLLVILSIVLIHVGVRLHYFEFPDWVSRSTIIEAAPGVHGMGRAAPVFQLLATLLSIMFSLNLLLFIFNLLPLPPLDGSNIPLLFLDPEKANRYIEYLRHPTFALLGVMIGYRVFPLIFLPVEQLARDWAFFRWL